MAQKLVLANHSARDAGGKWSKLIEKNKLEKIDASINKKVADLEKKLKKEKEKFDATRSGVPQAVKALNFKKKFSAATKISN